MGEVRTIYCWQQQKSNNTKFEVHFMTIIHANDPTTQFLSLLYNQREDIKAVVTEKNSNMEVIRAIRGDETIMMLGHGSEAGLCSIIDDNLDFERTPVRKYGCSTAIRGWGEYRKESSKTKRVVNW